MKNLIPVLALAILLLFSCSKKDAAVSGNTNQSIPTVATTAVSSLLSVSVVSGGNISSDGGLPVLTRGVCWSLSAGASLSGSHTTDSSGSGAFVSTVSGLTANSTYYLRAYASNAKGTAYGNEISFITPAPEPSIYVAGWEGAEPRLWKNGVLVDLNVNGAATQLAGVVVSDNNDIYVVGTQTRVLPNNTDRAWIWKNGTGTQLTNGATNAAGLALAVSGNDVYAGGYENLGTKRVAKIWKNGVASSLTDGTKDAQVESIVISGTDVYASGLEGNMPTIWKNGIATVLTTSPVTGKAINVFVSGTDVYACGYTSAAAPGTGGATLWKNGNSNSLMNGTLTASFSIYVSGADVYATCNQGNTAYLWKNGALINIDNSGKATTPYKMFVNGNDIYIAGYENTGSGIKALYWKNGKATALSSGTTTCYAWSIFVK